ncbi:MAG: hypothetical protein ACREDR_45490 [Blastocatellia bacterium]
MKKCAAMVWEQSSDEIIDSAGWPGIDLMILSELLEDNPRDQKHAGKAAAKTVNSAKDRP